jgi:hypothetical protein
MSGDALVFADVQAAVATLRENAIEPKRCRSCREPLHVLTPFGWAEPDHTIELCQRCTDGLREHVLAEHRPIILPGHVESVWFTATVAP